MTPAAGAKRALAALAVALLGTLAAPARAVLDEPTPAQASDADYAAGRAALEAKQWDEAVRRLERAAVRHPDDADLHNALGYAYRNRKQLDLAFTHYKRALALDPRHRGAHEYIGEAYLMAGDVASAQKHLDALRRICLLPCDEQKDLEAAIARHRSDPATSK
ncbi:MAG TPA: tetratricopeptide repeat protein [Casimicrobiaceae bacterium]|nr:tetratricopeptide repeat protein [Casimicrobiaceae bacterium]